MNEIRGVRKKNVIKIIQSLVKQGGCTKNELVFYTGLSLSTIDSLLEEMLKSNLVIKAGYRESTGGRPSMSYTVNGEFSQTLCIYAYKHDKTITVIGRLYNLYSEMMEERRKDVSKLDYEVLCSFIEEMLNAQVHTICLSLPDCDIDIKNRYKQRILIENNVYMGAIGAYIKHMQYDSLVLLDSKGDSRLGIVINGHLVEGKSSIAGQIRYMPLIENKNRRSMKGRSQLLVIELQNIIGMLNPEAIVICAQGIDQHYVEEELLKIFKMNDMPHLIYIDNYIDEVMLGMESISKDSLFDKMSR
jgi:predicted transcriptional regulator